MELMPAAVPGAKGMEIQGPAGGIYLDPDREVKESPDRSLLTDGFQERRTREPAIMSWSACFFSVTPARM